MQQFFFMLSQKLDGKIILDDPGVVHHAKKVLRLKENQMVSAVDEFGGKYMCVIEGIGEKITLSVKEKVVCPEEEKRLQISAACAIPKKSKFDEIVDKLTQLGVDRIIPLKTERVIVKLTKDKELLRQRRWEKIAKSASIQSKQRSIPQVELPCSLKEALEKSDGYDLKIIPHLEEKVISLKEAVNSSEVGKVIFFIGPEGDFTPEEIALAKKYGCVEVSLGEEVLRVDTAAIAVASFLRLNEDR